LKTWTGLEWLRIVESILVLKIWTGLKWLRIVEPILGFEDTDWIKVA